MMDDLTFGGVRQTRPYKECTKRETNRIGFPPPFIFRCPREGRRKIALRSFYLDWVWEGRARRSGPDTSYQRPVMGSHSLLSSKVSWMVEKEFLCGGDEICGQ